MKVCHRCRAPWSEPGQPGFNNTCSSCGMALHSCANCRWFVSTSRKVRCLKPGTPTILDASAGNRCTAFDFSSVDAAVAARAASAEGSVGVQTPKQSWERLFGA